MSALSQASDLLVLKLGKAAGNFEFVRLPATVVGIADNAFRRCQLLNSVTAPGCREFAIAECSSLQWVYAVEGVANQFCSATKFGHYLFRDCINLAEFNLRDALPPSGLSPQSTARELAQGCLSSTGTTTLTLTQDFSVLGHMPVTTVTC